MRQLWADSCMGGRTKSGVLENSFHAEQDGSLAPTHCLSWCPLGCPLLPHTRDVSPQVLVTCGAACSLSSVPHLLPESCPPIGVAVPCVPWPHWHRAPRMSWGFPGLGSSMEPYGEGLTGLGLSICTFLACAHGQWSFPPSTECLDSLEPEYLRVSLGRKGGGCTEESGRDFYLDYSKLL